MDFGFPQNEDGHLNIATLFKRYLRAMKEPLLTFELYSVFISSEANIDEEERKINLKNALSLLPEKNRDLLHIICEFLREVATYPENKMTAEALAIVFSQNLMKPESEDPVKSIADSTHIISLVASFIEEFDYYFPKDVSTSNAGVETTFKNYMDDNYNKYYEENKNIFNKVLKKKGLEENTFARRLSSMGELIQNGEIEIEQLPRMSNPERSRSLNQGDTLKILEKL